MKYLYSIVLLLVACVNSFSETNVVEVKDIDKLEGKYAAKIFFPVPVNWKTVSDLVRSIEVINLNYRNVDKIYLYIDSGGGDVDAAYAAFHVIKASSIPIVTVNMGKVISAASMIYCGAKERATFQSSLFYLHAPMLDNYGVSNLSDISRQEALLQIGVTKLQETYADCLRFDEEDRKALYSSEEKRLIFDATEAKRRKLVSTIATDGTVPSMLTIFISEDQRK